jgi:hypothetical protein
LHNNVRAARGSLEGNPRFWTTHFLTALDVSQRHG